MHKINTEVQLTSWHAGAKVTEYCNILEMHVNEN